MKLALIALTGPDETVLTLATRHLVEKHGFWTIYCSQQQELQTLQDDIDDANGAKPEFHITHAVVNAVHNEAQADLIRAAGGIVLHFAPATAETGITQAAQDKRCTDYSYPKNLYRFLDVMVWTDMATAA